jgi:hypothetical protein
MTLAQKMNLRATKIATLSLTVAYFVIGWIAYTFVLRFVSSGVGAPMAISYPREELTHQLSMALMIGFLGLMTGLATLVSGRFSVRQKYRTRFIYFLIGGLVTAVGITSYLSHEFSMVGQLINSGQTDPASRGLPWSIRAFPLYQIGLYSGLAVLIAGGVICFKTSTVENRNG